MNFFLFVLYLSPIVIFFIFPSLLTFIKKHVRKEEFPLPPGRTGWPLIGETLDYLAKKNNGIPERFVSDRINKHSSKVFKTSLFGERMAMLWGTEGNKFLFSNEGKKVWSWFPKYVTKIYPRSGSGSLNDTTANSRKILRPFLKGNALHGYVPIMDTIAKNHLESDWDDKKEFIKVSEIVPKLTLTIACCLLFSIEDPNIVEEIDKRIKDVEKGLMSLGVNLPGTAFHRAVKASKAVRKLIEGIIKQRKIDLLENKSSAFQKNDMVSHVLRANDDSEYIHDFDIASSLFGLLHAGYAPLNSALTSIMMYLTELPDVYDKVLKEKMEIARSKEPNQLLNWDDISKIRYSWNVACEVLRLDPPATGTFREAITDFVYNGYTIPKGWKLHWMLYSMHKNAEYFPDPEKFDPSRFEGNGAPSYAFVPFGGGPRMCPSNEYSRLEILVFMHNVVTKFKWEKIHNEKVLSNRLATPYQGLLICLHPRRL